MAGTRLVVHATFVVELLILVVASVLYASTRHHDPRSSAEPFLADRSGWKILIEDVVSPVPSPGGDVIDGGGIGIGVIIGDVIARAGDWAGAMASEIEALVTGGEAKERRAGPDDRPRLASAFVREMRAKVAGFPGGGDDNVLPPMRVNLVAPLSGSPAAMESLAEALDRGFQSERNRSGQGPHLKIRVATVDSTVNNFLPESSAGEGSCDDYRRPTRSERTTFSGRRRDVRSPEIVVLTSCSSATVSDRRLSSVEVDLDGDVVVVRTVLATDQMEKLLRHLENDVSIALSRALFVPLANDGGRRLGSISIKLIDEDPASHSAGDAANSDGFAARDRFDLLGRALSSSIRSTFGSLVEDLSFIYGGKIEAEENESSLSYGSVIYVEDAISLEAHPSAYLPLPMDIVELESPHDESIPVNYVSSGDLADWMHAHSREHAVGDVEWVLFVPSREKTPLVVHDDASGAEGRSIILSSPTLDGAETKYAYPNGISFVNLPTLLEHHGSNPNTVDLDQVKENYRDVVSQSLTHITGYIRSIHGLLPYRKHAALSSSDLLVEHIGDDTRTFSFWELESIARSRYPSSLELALHEMDALMALLHQHSGTLAFPMDVAHKLNNATHFLRQSISLIEKGFPAVHAAALLHGSLQRLESVRSDHQFMELPYFAADHYLAVFSPLVLPLLLPMILGLVREVKRFRELRKKQDKC